MRQKPMLVPSKQWHLKGIELRTDFLTECYNRAHRKTIREPETQRLTAKNGKNPMNKTYRRVG